MDQQWCRNVIRTIFHDCRTHRYWSDINLYNIWLFDSLKWILKDWDNTSNDEIEEAIQTHWNDTIFDDMQNIIYDRMHCLESITENGENMFLSKAELTSSSLMNLAKGCAVDCCYVLSCFVLLCQFLWKSKNCWRFPDLMMRRTMQGVVADFRRDKDMK
jgi:hypothetical protein